MMNMHSATTALLVENRDKDHKATSRPSSLEIECNLKVNKSLHEKGIYYNIISIFF